MATTAPAAQWNQHLLTFGPTKLLEAQEVTEEVVQVIMDELINDTVQRLGRNQQILRAEHGSSTDLGCFEGRTFDDQMVRRCWG